MRSLPRSLPRLAALLLAAALLAPALAWAQRAAAPDYFPLAAGHQWTYRMRVRAGDQRRSIEYTTRAERVEEIEGVGPCVVLESRSDRRLMLVEWYRVDGSKLLLPQRQEGASEERRRSLGERVFLDLAAVEAVVERRIGDAKPSWTWSLPDGQGEGTVTIEGIEPLHLRNFGMLDCLVVVSTGRYRLGKKVRVQERRLWLAPDVGLVKESMRVEKESGEVTIETEAVLTRHEAP